MITLFAMLSLPFALHAQNKIDDMVQRYSTVGSATFTTVVQRNPSTRAVEKVVKKLSMNSTTSKKLIDGFNAEASQYSVSRKQEGGYTTVIFAVPGNKSNRVYMIKYQSRTYVPFVEVTIIINMK